MSALDEHLADPNINFTNSRKVMLEYVVIKDVNDSDICAHKLAALLRPRWVYVCIKTFKLTQGMHCYFRPRRGPNGKRIVLNLIPYNPTGRNYLGEKGQNVNCSKPQMSQKIMKPLKLIV